MYTATRSKYNNIIKCATKNKQTNKQTNKNKHD